ncbi:MAG: DEAD/DEAH box helicase [Dehalococcoidales bacterium]|nr:DEAD/DEAH box helicase [Dehalococcoidales bacterium]
MDTAAFLKYITTLPFYKGQIAHLEHIAPQKAQYGELEKPLAPELAECLQKRGFLPMYTHQAESVNQAIAGNNVMVVTPSASGKTLCYNVPVIQTLSTNPASRALYLFPTKALAQDQLRTLHEDFCPDIFDMLSFATFDGDTPQRERADIRKSARIVLSNPDMLHVGILPNHQQWSRFLRSLKYVVIDEAHIYRGVFGSHLAGVIRRLRRLCHAYGAAPQFILASATIANPAELAEKLTGLKFSVVDIDGAPHGGRDFVFWNPPIIDEIKGARRSANSEATTLFTELLLRDTRTLTFVRTRRLTELIYNYTRTNLRAEKPALVKRVKPYRAGYLAADRRQIEKQLFSGELLGVVATNALELGIDIGNLDATVLTGYPGTIASTWQQAGRSGRSKEKALSILVGLDNPLDQYFMKHPDFFFKKNYEHALVNPENPYIVRGHLLSAAWELPLTKADEKYFGAALPNELPALEERGLLKERREKWYVSTSVSYPAQNINIRSSSGENYALIDVSTGAMLETVEANIAFFQIHRGAIYLHQGDTYLITDLDLRTHTAYAVPTDANYYTQARELTDLHILKVLKSKFVGRVEVHLGEVEVTSSVLGYRKKAQYSEEVIGEENLELPPQVFPTVALWFDLPESALAVINKELLDVAGALHATEHAAIGILPLFAICDRNDIGGVSTPLHADTGKPQVFIYDGHPGGVGIAEKGYEIIEELWRATLELVRECPCLEGCPSCIQSPKCGNNNKPLDKKAAIILLRSLVSKNIRSLI